MREPSFWWREASLASALLAPLAAIYGAVARARLERTRPPCRRAGGLHRQFHRRRRRQDADGAGGGADAGGGGRAAGIPQPRLWRGACGPGPGRSDAASRAGRGRRAAAARAHGADHRGARPRQGRRPSPPARASSSWTTASRIRRWPRTFRCSWSTPGAASAMAGSSRPVRCGRRSTRSSRAPMRWWWSGRRRAPQPSRRRARARNIPVLPARLRPDAGFIAALGGSRVLAFAGIGDPEKFFA